MHTRMIFIGAQFYPFLDLRMPKPRMQIYLWLGQSNDPRALDFIESVLKR